MKYFDTYFCHYTLCTSVYIRVTQHTKFQRVRRQTQSDNRQFVKNNWGLRLLTKQITARKTNTTSSSCKSKPHYLDQNYNQSVILFMWAQQFGENILLGVRARAWLEASDRRVSVTGPSQKHFRLSYQRNCERRRGPEETVPMEPEWH